MNLNEDRKAPLRGKDLSTKREMVVQYISATAKSVSEVMFFLSLMFSVVGQVVVDDVSFNSSPTFFILPFIPRWCHSLFHPHVFMLESRNFDLFPVFVYFSIFWLKQRGLQKSISPFFLGGWSALCMKTVLCGCLSAHVVCPLVAVCLSVLLFVGCEEHDNETMILGSFLSRHTHSFNLLTSKFNLLTSHFRGPRSQQSFDEGGMHTRNHTCQFRVNYEIKFKSVCWNQSSYRNTEYAKSIQKGWDL